MVKKVQKAKAKASNLKPSTSEKKGTSAKANSLKPSTSVKRGTATKTKAKSEEKLSNGYGDTENEKESTMDMEVEVSAPSEKTNTHETQENMDFQEEQRHETKDSVDSAKQEQSVEIEDGTVKDVKTASKSRKRKADVDIKAKKEVVTRTKAKKQKVYLQIPERSTIVGKVFVVGENLVGQLGFGEDVPEKSRPALLELPHSIVDIAAGGMHSVCLTETGEVITFGCNDEGALGRITSEEGSECVPEKVDIPERIVQVSAGDSHSAALSESGQVYIWGNFRNSNGPMGLITDDAKQYTPVKILSDVTVVKIASGSDHLACLSHEGVVYTCGCGETGQLGRVSERASSDGGRKGKMLLLKPDKVPVSKSSRSCTVNNIWTGLYSTFLNVEETGKIYAFGLNNYNQLGLTGQGTVWNAKELTSFRNTTWLHINAGQHHALTLDTAGFVYSLGRSEYGRLGLGENCDDKSEPTTIPALQATKCVDISCGNTASFAVTDNGSVYSWGMGAYQLGHGDESDQHMPQRIEGSFSKSWEAFKISGGGQHTLILAHPRKSSEKK